MGTIPPPHPDDDEGWSRFEVGMLRVELICILIACLGMLVIVILIGMRRILSQ